MSPGDPQGCGQCPYRNGGFGYNPYISMSPPAMLLKVRCPICLGTGQEEVGYGVPPGTTTYSVRKTCRGCGGSGIQEVSYSGSI
jgi:DnaJ-class molecular chaperone